MNAQTSRASAALSWVRAWRLHLSLAVLIGMAAGCIILPTPEMDSGETRANISQQTPAQFVPGETTRAEVILVLGEPDAITPDERKLVYRREQIIAIWFAGGGYTADAGSIESDRYLVAEFDTAGVLTKVEFSRHLLGSRDPDQLLDVASVETNQDASIRLQARADWLAGVRDYRSLSLRDANVTWVTGRLVLTDTELRFFSKSQLANEPPALTLPYTKVKDARLEWFLFGKLLVVDEQTGGNCAFLVWDLAKFQDSRETRQKACDLIRSKINPSKP
jgi:hypothetical protein